MERYFMLGLGLLAILAFVSRFFFGSCATFLFISVLGHRSTGTSGLAADLVPYFAPLMPQQYTDQGH